MKIERTTKGVIRMKEKIISNATWLVVVSAMGWMVYTGNFTYVNAITVYYVLMLILAVLMCLFIVVMIATKSGEAAKVETVDAIRKISKVGVGFGGALSYIKTAINIILLVMCGYVTLIVFYVIITGCILVLCKKYREWVAEHDELIK